MQPLTSSNSLVSVKVAANLLGASIQALRMWDAAGLLVPTYRTPGKHRRYTLQQIYEFKARRDGRHPAPAADPAPSAEADPR